MNWMQFRMQSCIWSHRRRALPVCAYTRRRSSWSSPTWEAQEAMSFPAENNLCAQSGRAASSALRTIQPISISKIPGNCCPLHGATSSANTVHRSTRLAVPPQQQLGLHGCRCPRRAFAVPPSSAFAVPPAATHWTQQRRLGPVHHLLQRVLLAPHNRSRSREP